MNRLYDAIQRVASDLQQCRAKWALIGGLAVSARSEPRFTRDADLAVAVSDDNEAQSIVRRLLSSGYRVVFTVEQKAAKRLATVRLEPPTGEGIVDVLFASSGIEPEIVRQAEVLELVHGVRLPVAALSHLLALKTLSRDDVSRPQDLADLRQLLSRATPRDLEAARQALQQITERGFNRGRSLLSDFDQLTGGGSCEGSLP